MFCQELEEPDVLKLGPLLTQNLKELSLSNKCIITKVNWGNSTKGYFEPLS